MLPSLNNLFLLSFPMVKLSYASCLPQSFLPTTANTITLSSSTSATSSPAKEYSELDNASFTIETSAASPSQAHSITPAPFQTTTPEHKPNPTSIHGSECLLQEAHCSLRGPGHSLDDLKDGCVLWDTSCSGNRSLATKHFYGSIMHGLKKNKCFYDSSPDCTKNNPLGRMSAFDKAKEWMRSSQCDAESPSIIELKGTENADLVKENSFLNQTCCDNCQVAVDRVDIYYWPSPHADTSCLSIIGDGESDLAVGATTENSDIYWACTSWSSSQGQSGPGSPVIITTATLTTIASLTFRTHLCNPWINSPCESSAGALSSSLNSKVKRDGTGQSLHPRGHSLVAPNVLVSTTVLGEFTL